MSEVRFKVDDAYLSQLSNLLGNRRTTDIMADALAILKWAADERAAGRQVVSANPDGSDAARLVMPALEFAAASSAVPAPAKTGSR